MKNALTALISFGFLGLSAQVYTPFPDSNSYWLFSLEDSQSIMEHTAFFVPANKEDTVINNTTYLKAYKYSGNFSSWETSYLCSFRKDSSGLKAFAVPPGYTTEYPLFDYTLSIGDSIDSLLIFTIYDHSLNSNQDTYYFGNAEVIDLGSDVFSGPNMYTYLDLNIYSGTPSYLGSNWLIHQSSYYSFVHSPFNNPNAYGLQNSQIICISANDTIRYQYTNTFNQDIYIPPMGSVSNCLDILTNLNETKKEVRPNLILNNNHLFVSNISSVSIINSFGSQVYSENKIVSKEIDLSLFSKGIYSISYYRNAEIHAQKIVIE